MFRDMEDIILDFWRCSLKSDFSEFDWDEAFDNYDPFLARNCIEHGQGTFDEFVDSQDEYLGLDNLADQIERIGGLTTWDGNMWWSFTGHDALMAILEAKYKACRKAFESNIHGDNAELLERIRDRSGLTEPELISLFDEAIHAQHCNGDILEDVDIEELREQAEQEWEDEQENPKFPTKIREFL